MVTRKGEHSVVQKRLDVNDILVAEFNYIASTAFQANEDRARVSNYYLMTALALSVVLVDSGAAVAGAAFMGVAMNWTLSQIWPLLVLVGVTFIGIQSRLYFAWVAK